MPFVLDFGTAVAMVAGGAMLALAAVLVVLDFTSRLHRAVALFLFLRGLLELSIAFTVDVADLVGRLRVYLLIAVPFSVLWFAFVYRWRFSPSPRRESAYLAWGLVILTTCLLAETLYMSDHSRYADTSGAAVEEGPLHAFAYLPFLAYAALALLFVSEARSRQGARQIPLLLAGFGLSVEPLYYASFRIADSVLDASVGDQGAPTGFVVAELATYGAALVVLAIALSRVPGGHARRRFALGWMPPVASALVVAILFATLDSPAHAVRFLQFFLGAWSLALPILLSYALVRHRLFDVDVKLRFAIRGTTLAATFLAVFFIANKVTENIVASRFENEGIGIYVGGAVAGLLLFALNPLQTLADRIAATAVPQVRGGLSPAQKAQLYREQLEIAWRDGRLTPKERLLFNRLQERLGIAAAEATRLENDVLQALDLPGGRRKKAAPA